MERDCMEFDVLIVGADTSLLPKRKAAWASWNYLLEGSEDEHQCLEEISIYLLSPLALLFHFSLSVGNYFLP